MQLQAQHPKAEPINVGEPGVYYGNPRFSLVFQRGPIDPHGNLNGVLEEEVLAVLIDRAQVTGQSALADALTTAAGIASKSREPEDSTDVVLAPETTAATDAT